MVNREMVLVAMMNGGFSRPPGRLFIVSAPSGAGKTTLCRWALKQCPRMVYSVSYTTRKPRSGETHGVDYYFIEEEAFKQGIREGRWAEWALVYGNYYGTSGRFIEKQLKKGLDVLLDIDVQGSAQIVQKFPESITIFIMPPRLDELRRRLEKRGSDDPKTIVRRLAAAEKEMAQRHLYRHVIVNDDFALAGKQLLEILTGKACARTFDAQ